MAFCDIQTEILLAELFSSQMGWKGTQVWEALGQYPDPWRQL